MENTKNFIRALQENESTLLRFLTWKTGCTEAAADVFQRIAEKLLTLDRENRLPAEMQRSYLFKATSNEAISYRRQEARRAAYESDSAERHGDQVEHSAERVATAQDGLRVLQEALDELPLLTRRIFVQYRVEGRKQQEIARALGLSLSTVEKRLATAMEHCRRRLGETEVYGTFPPLASKR